MAVSSGWQDTSSSAPNSNVADCSSMAASCDEPAGEADRCSASSDSAWDDRRWRLLRRMAVRCGKQRSTRSRCWSFSCGQCVRSRHAKCSEGKEDDVDDDRYSSCCSERGVNVVDDHDVLCPASAESC